MSEEQIDQITKEPENPIIKQKDPKKVAAGKRLAEYHKKARDALKIEKDRETGGETPSNWVPEISLAAGLSLIGITLTAVDLYFRWYKKPEVDAPVKKSPKIESNDGNDVASNKIKSKIPVARIGME